MRIGKVPENVLKRSVLRQMHGKREELISGAGMGEDCAIFSLQEDENSVTCSLAGWQLFPFDDEWIRRLLTNCANRLAAAGAKPIAISIDFLMPTDVEEAELQALMKQADEAAELLGMGIAKAQAVSSDVVRNVTAYVSGFGKLAKGTDYSVSRAAPGQDIVLSKWIGIEGTALLAKQASDVLLERYPGHLVKEAEGFSKELSVLPEAATAIKSGVCAMLALSEGGILGTLRELAEGAGVGLSVDLKKFPIRQETVEVCECCEVNPYALLSGGSLLMTTSDGEGLVEALAAKKIPATIIGRLTEGNDRVIHNDDEIRYLDRAAQDEIYRYLEAEKS